MPSQAALVAIPFRPDNAGLDAALDAFGDAGSSSGSAIDATKRRAALAAYHRLPIPGGRPGRAWKYDYAKLPLAELAWSTGRRSVPTSPLDALAAADPSVDHPALATESAGGIAHLGAILLQGPGPTARDPRVIVTSLADALRDHAALLEPVLHAIVDFETDRFSALATAFQNCGAFVYVPAGVSVSEPIQLLFAAGTGMGAAVFPHIVVVLGEGARATVIERYTGDGDALVCGIVEAHVGPSAVLDLVTVQQASDEARYFSTRAARCERDGVMRWHVAELGGALARTTIATGLESVGARGEVSALFFTGGSQHVDLAIHTDHRVGPSFSDTVVRSAATDRGQGRFFGNIVIREHSHGADAALRDDALLLSKDAHIDSVPALEIAANDVKAFHGATVGSVDDEQLFYARSRGIARTDALRMIALGFFEPVISRFPGERLRDEIRTALDQKIDDATELD